MMGNTTGVVRKEGIFREHVVTDITKVTMVIVLRSCWRDIVYCTFSFDFHQYREIKRICRLAKT
jgi:hypothetical protein